MKRTAPMSPTMNAAGSAIVGNSGAGMGSCTQATLKMTSLISLPIPNP